MSDLKTVREALEQIAGNEWTCYAHTGDVHQDCAVSMAREALAALSRLEAQQSPGWTPRFGQDPEEQIVPQAAPPVEPCPVRKALEWIAGEVPCSLDYTEDENGVPLSPDAQEHRRKLHLSYCRRCKAREALASPCSPCPRCDRLQAAVKPLLDALQPIAAYYEHVASRYTIDGQGILLTDVEGEDRHALRQHHLAAAYNVWKSVAEHAQEKA